MTCKDCIYFEDGYCKFWMWHVGEDDCCELFYPASGEEQFKRRLRSSGIDPDKAYTVTITVNELELNALEDLLYAELDKDEEKVMRTIVGRLWHKLVSAVDKEGGSENEA